MMKLKFSKKIGKETSLLYVEIEYNSPEGKLGIQLTEEQVQFTYNNGYFELLSPLKIEDKEFNKIKCPKHMISNIEEYMVIG